DQYVPPWRAACDAWVTINVLDTPGENTPVYQLYNAYINDNPDDYMDIGQFGKVLTSRFPYRKRRRGKQGQQVYVYQDVALRNKTSSTNESEKMKNFTQMSLQSPPDEAGPPIVVGNNSGGRLLTTPTTYEEESSDTLPDNSVKRYNLDESHIRLSPNSKRQKVSKDRGFYGLSHNKARFKTFSNHPDHTQMIEMMTTKLLEEDKQNRVNGEKGKIPAKDRHMQLSQDKDTKISGKQSDIMQWTKVKHINVNSLQLNQYDKMKASETTDINHMLYSDANFIGKITQKNGFRTKQNLRSNVTLFKQKGDEKKTFDSSVGELQHPSDVNPSYSTSEDEKYASAGLCRMAIGRRWIDTNLVDMPGVQTAAEDICQAYAEDNPDEPLAFTSLALLIRGKYPGRRKRISIGKETKYIFRDISLKKEFIRISTDHPTVTLEKPSRRLPIKETTFKLQQTTESEKHSASNYLLFVPQSETKTTVPYTGSYPVKKSMVSGTGSRRKESSKPLSISSQPGTSFVLAKSSDLPAPLHNEQNNHSFSIASLYNDYDFSYSESKAEPPYGDGQQSVQNAPHDLEYITQKLPDMDVSDYIEAELLEINEMNTGLQNYTFSIKIPSGNQEVPYSFGSHEQFTTWRPSRQLESPDPFPAPKESCTPIINQDTSDQEVNTGKTRNSRIGKSVNVNPEINLNCTEKSLVSKKSRRNQTRSSNSKKKKSPETVRNFRGLEVEDPASFETTNEYFSSNLEKDSQFTNIPPYNFYYDKDNLSNNSRSSSRSPTSVSPSCLALHYPSQENDTYTPSLSEATNSNPFVASPTPSHVEEKIINISNNENNSEYRKTFRSVIITAKYILSERGATSENYIEKKLEKAIIENNPAVHYSDSINYDSITSESEPNSCVAGSILKDLVISQPTHISEFLQHHQACPGLGCSPECKALRAAYIHVTIFRHRCEVHKTFNNIISKHAKQCRLVFCGVEFCQFVKHELHQSGVSVLPMQLLKERLILEEEFKKCEAYGMHDGDLHCRHLRNPLLPSKNLGTKRRKGSEEPVTDVTMDTNIILPDTPNGNALSVPLMKTIELVKNLYQISS
ncbi:hypothetical protein SK128_001896, partial [Halocaridina rubra]